MRRSPVISAKLDLLEDDGEGGKERISYEADAPTAVGKNKVVGAGECVGPAVERKACDAGEWPGAVHFGKIRCQCH